MPKVAKSKTKNQKKNQHPKEVNPPLALKDLELYSSKVTTAQDWGRRFLPEVEIKKVDDSTRELYQSLLIDHTNHSNLLIENYEENRRLYEVYSAHWKGTKYFDLPHLDILGWKPNVYFITSKKNTGKTSAMYKDAKARILRGEKIIFGRLSVNETTGAFMQLQQDSDSGRCPFYMTHPYSSNRAANYLYVTPGLDPERPELDNQICGLCLPWSKCNTKMGATSWDDYTAVYFDEVIGWDRNFTFKGAFGGFEAFFSSLQRNSLKPVDCYLFGNLTGYKRDLLDFYEIDDNADLVKLNRSKYGKQYTDVLYINLGDIYTGGIDSQIGVIQGSPIRALEMTSNKVINLSTKKLTPTVFMRMDFVFAFVDHRCNVYELRRAKAGERDVYGFSFREYQPYEFHGCKVYTDNLLLSRANFNLVFMENLAPLKLRLYALCASNNLRFINSEDIYQLEKFKDLIIDKSDYKHGWI